jgi:pentose-5-phosphate-3-epimerase
MDRRRAQIAPSVLPADFASPGDECRALEKSGADRIQWDVMDGRFVPNLTSGPDVVAAVRPHTGLPFEAHPEVDSGIGPVTIGGAARAGADVFRAGSALYRHPDGRHRAARVCRGGPAMTRPRTGEQPCPTS